MSPTDPLPLSVALSELIALRGFARVRADNELEAAWKQVAGPEWSPQTRPSTIVSRGTLIVYVENPALLTELASFHGPELMHRLQQQFPHLKIKTLKFKLKGT